MFKIIHKKSIDSTNTWAYGINVITVISEQNKTCYLKIEPTALAVGDNIILFICIQLFKLKIENKRI